MNSTKMLKIKLKYLEGLSIAVTVETIGYIRILTCSNKLNTQNAPMENH